MATTVSVPRKVAATATTGAALGKGRHTPVDATSGAITMTLPTDAAAGVEIAVEKVDASANAVTISGTFRGVAASTIALTTQFEARTFLSEGAGSWRPTSDHRTNAALLASFASTSANDPLRYDTTRLRAFKAALGLRATTPVDILLVGDSVTEGQGASATPNRWVDRFRDRLRTAYQPAGVTGGEGYVPSFYVAADRAKRWSGTGTERQDLAGLGERVKLITAGNPTTMTFTGTGVDIFYTEGPSAGLGSWSVDGGAATQFNTNTATLNQAGKVMSAIRGLTPGSHTVTITHVSGGSGLYLEGAMVYNGDETKGIRVWEAAHAAYQSDDLDQVPATAGVNWFEDITPIQPDLVTIMLGLNDYGSGSQTRIAPAAFKTNLQSMISKIRAKCTIPPSILLVIPYERAVPTGTLLGTWAEYRQALLDLASADQKIALLDLGNVIGSFLGSVDPYDLDAADFLHPNDRGHQMIGDAAYEVVTTV